MKTFTRILFSLLLVAALAGQSFAQDQQVATTVNHKIVKQNGVAFVGRIISQDAREILLQTEEIGLVYIPKHEVKEIIELAKDEKPVTGGLFATRYFLTTNGFAIKKGDNYVQWNIFGPDFQFGVRDNFAVGVMTSWVGIPIVGTAKYRFQISKGIVGGVGFLGGTGSWAFPEFGLLLPFGFISAGDRVNNINFSAGYGLLFSQEEDYTYTIIDEPWYDHSINRYESNHEEVNRAEGRPLFSIAGMFRLNDKFSFVFDSFFMLPGKPETYQVLDEEWIEVFDEVRNENVVKVKYSLRDETRNTDPLVVLAPGLRFQATENSSFQFGFTGVHFDGEFLPVPIPMVQWFRRI